MPPAASNLEGVLRGFKLLPKAACEGSIFNQMSLLIRCLTELTWESLILSVHERALASVCAPDVAPPTNHRQSLINMFSQFLLNSGKKSL